MRIILIILSLSAFLFVGWIVLQNIGGTNVLTHQINSNQSTTSEIQTTSTVITNADPQLVQAIEQDLRSRQNEERIAKLEEKIGQISATTPIRTTETILETKNTEATNTGTTSSATTTIEAIPVSAKFLGKILPTIELTKIDNSGIFDLRIFDNTHYTTYHNESFGITVVASLLPYETFLKNFQAIDKNVYSVNEKTPFPFESFYVNPPKTDTMVRIVMKVESQTLFITLPKTKFNTFKELILKKNS